MTESFVSCVAYNSDAAAATTTTTSTTITTSAITTTTTGATMYRFEKTPTTEPQNSEIQQKSIKYQIQINQTIDILMKSYDFPMRKNVGNFDYFEQTGTDLGWFGDDFGMVWGYFRDGLGPIFKSRKNEGPELNQLSLK